MSNNTVYVHVEIGRVTRLVGRLFVRTARGKDTATFVYDEAWVSAPDNFALEPALQLSTAPHHTASGRALFGAIGDSAPDRWGQTLLRRNERATAKREGRAPRSLREIDFLLGVSDETRQGALRFSESEGGPFLAPAKQSGVPLSVKLPQLLAATHRFLQGDESADDLRLLLAPGSSLGGARPKASVRDQGRLLIAKFPKPDDDYADVLLVGRFDRRGDERVPFLVLISNTDDHLRNHGFLYSGGGGWRLSPAYDINPVPTDVKPRMLSTAIGADLDPTASLSGAMEVIEYFDLTNDAARAIVRDVAASAATWRDVASQKGIASAEIDRVSSAFEHADMHEAQAI